MNKKTQEELEREIAEKANLMAEKEIEKKLKGEIVEEEAEKETPLGVPQNTESRGRVPERGREPRGRFVRKSEEEIRKEVVAAWEPKTKLGREVKDGKIKNIDEILDSGRKILESEMVDSLMHLKSDLISIGQAKGKFGGGKRRAWRQTQRKKKEGNVPTFSTMAVVGDEKGHVGVGSGRAKETLPARDKAVRKAKLSIIRIKRDCAAFDCDCSELHTVPFEVVGKCGSVRVVLTPAPQGSGLVVGKELKKVLQLAGIKDVYSKTFGKKRTTFNLVKACIDALKKTNVEAHRSVYPKTLNEVAKQ